MAELQASHPKQHRSRCTTNLRAFWLHITGRRPTRQAGKESGVFTPLMMWSACF